MSAAHKARIAAVERALNRETDMNRRIELVCKKLALNGYGKEE